MLHATVIDNKQHIITNLEKGSFTVFEDGHPQTITSFRHEDIPVAMCIVVDNSGSMREKREKVNAAALNLVRASNPNDEVCVVNFNDEYYLDQDFTANINKLKEGLEKIEARGGTALYDAVVASATHLKENAKLEKKVIFVVTDGDDNESSETLEQAVRRLQADNGPVVYAIGLLEGEEHAKHAKRALQIMCESTGGIAFLPKTLDEVDAISRESHTTFAANTPSGTSQPRRKLKADTAKCEWKPRRPNQASSPSAPKAATTLAQNRQREPSSIYHHGVTKSRRRP